MAYSIIAQNNSTTTLADENGNVITVPSRSILDAGTTFTLVKINNNTATLEDSNGKVYRDIPCCIDLTQVTGFNVTKVNNNKATLEDGDGNVYAGVPCIVNLTESGGGGSADYSKTVQRAETMPVASADNANQQFLYAGATDANYTHDYIYENVPTTTSSSASAVQTVGSTLSDIAVDLATLEAFTGWTTDNSLQIFYTADGWSVDATSLGVTYTGTPNVGDAITITYTAAVTTYAWTRVDVQPAPSGLPDQTGQSGKFLTTDGTDASWSDKPLVNKATGSNSLSIGPATTYNGCVNVGLNSGCLGNNAVAVGRYAKASLGSVAIGVSAEAIGHNYMIAVGASAKPAAVGAIQISTRQDGNYSYNYDANTFKVANANGNYEIMSADGTVPTARLTKVNTTATLSVADWSSNTQTVSVTGVTATGIVFVSPDPSDQADYTSAGILCTAQAAGTLTFTCDTTPSNDIDVVVVMM